MSTHEAYLILEGEYSNEEIVDAGKLLIEQMKRTTKLDSNEKFLTKEEWVGKMKVWKETTTTSPSKLHLGHHKSLIYEFEDDDKINNEEKRWDFLQELSSKLVKPSSSNTLTQSSNSSEIDSIEEPNLESMRKSLLTAQIMLMNYAIKHEYVYERWKML